MARMIDADALQELCNKRIKDTWNSKTAPVSWAEAYADFKDDINSIPAFTQPGNPLTLEQLRERWERCEHCRGTNELRYPSAHELVIDGRDIYYHDTDDGWEGVEINFCPWCGRPLTDEAWAKLERRLQGMPLPKPPEEG